MLTSGGGGYSRRNDMAVTRWQEDISQDNWGMFCYLRDVQTNTVWSAAHQPTLHQPESHEAIFSDSRAEFRARNLDFDTHLEIVVSPEDDIELRRLHVTNRASAAKTLELTTYTEVVLTSAANDAMHPAFSKLFVQTELLPELQAILCSRRPRASDESVPWMCHLLAAPRRGHRGDFVRNRSRPIHRPRAQSWCRLLLWMRVASACQAALARCWTPWLRFAAELPCNPANRQPSTWSPASPTAEMAASI